MNNLVLYDRILKKNLSKKRTMHFQQLETKNCDTVSIWSETMEREQITYKSRDHYMFENIKAALNFRIELLSCPFAAAP